MGQLSKSCTEALGCSIPPVAACMGDTGHGWATTIAAIRPPHVKVICPTANKMPVTLNSGFEMPSWFDLMTLDATGPEDEQGIKAAAVLVNTLIAEEVKAGVPSER